MNPSTLLRLASLAVFVLVSSPARADVKLPAIFGDHMVLQRDTRVPVWGWASPGEAITVTFNDRSVKAIAGLDGKWRTDLAPLPPTTAPGTLTVSGNNTVKFEDVLLGDVWLCSGQSNMDFTVSQCSNAATEIPAADFPRLRLFTVRKKGWLQTMDTLNGSWQICTPQTVPDFSAVAYFFGRALHRATGQPVGLIRSAWGGTVIEAWTSYEALNSDPSMHGFVETVDRRRADVLVRQEQYKQSVATYEADQKAWNESVGKPYQTALNDWKSQAEAAKAANQPEPPQPQPDRPSPKRPSPFVEYWEGTPHVPTVMYNGMIAPLIPFALKGIVWYQGESNVPNDNLYRRQLPVMINDWRTRWGQGDLPFLIVQLPNIGGPALMPVRSAWAGMREAQQSALSLPATGLTVTIDLGDGNLHPPDKIDVGERLALLARHMAYGENLVYTGPTFESMKVEGDKVRVAFGNVGGGLTIGTGPLKRDTAADTEIRGFVILGADHKWYPAHAAIDGNTVVLSQANVTAPTAVRYDWADNPGGNLYNKEGLPAAPFRSDSNP